MYIRFDSARHGEFVAHLDQALSGIAIEIDLLDREATRLRGDWHGSARDAYDRTHTAGAALLDELERGLRGARDFASATAERFVATERAVRALWRR